LESQFFLTYQIHGWDWLARPVVLILLALAIVGFARQAVLWYRTRGAKAALPAAPADTLFAATVALVALAAFVTALRFPFEAGIFPLISAAVLAILSLAVTAQALARWRRGQAA